MHADRAQLGVRRIYIYGRCPAHKKSHAGKSLLFGKRESDLLDERIEYIVLDLVSANFVYKISSMLRIAARRLDKHVVLVRGPCSQIAVLHLTVHQYMLHGPWVTAWP